MISGMLPTALHGHALYFQVKIVVAQSPMDSIDLYRRLRERRQGTISSFTLCSKTASGKMISSQILASIPPFEILLAGIHDPCV